MDISYKNYILKQSGDRFDLYKTVIRTKKNSEETYQSEKDIGYGFTLENGVRRLIMEELANNNDVVTLKQFIEDYNKEREEINKLFGV